MQLIKFEGCCGYCTVMKVDTTTKHTISDCPTLANHIPGFTVAAYIVWRQQIRYSSQYHGFICYFCHVSLSPCLHYHFSCRPEDCHYRDLIASTVYGILADPETHVRVQNKFPTAGLSSPANAIQWINVEPLPGHCSNLTALFLWYAENL